MTTRAEIRRWVKPFVASRADIVLSQRAVLVTPVHHVARGMYFRSTSTKTYPEVAWFFELLFAAPGSWNAAFDRRFRPGESTAGDFPAKLERTMQQSFEQYLLPVRSIADFHDFAIGPETRFTFLNLDDYGLEHGTVLAALGRLDEAEALLQATIAETEAWAANEQRADDELRRTKPRPRGTIILHVGRDKMKIVEVVRELLTYVRARDRAGIGTLLRQWEHARVRRREIELLWEPTPFPVEADA